MMYNTSPLFWLRTPDDATANGRKVMGRNSSGSGVGQQKGGGGRDFATTAPVTLYRKNIGRQNSQKEKKLLREMRQEQEARDKAPRAFREMVRKEGTL